MRTILKLQLAALLLVVPAVAQTRNAKRAAVGIHGEGAKRTYTPPASPMARIRESRQFSAAVEIPEQGFLSRLAHGERWYTKHLDFQQWQRCERIPTLWADELEGRYLEIRLDNPSGTGVDVSAPQGRTVFISWTCR